MSVLIYICEDSTSDTLRLKHYLENFSKEKKLDFKIMSFTSSEALSAAFAQPQVQPELLFLDIYMDGKDGMNTAKELRSLGFEGGIIFTTSSTQHAMDSYEVNALYYLQKPYTHSHFLNAMERCSHILPKAQPCFTYTKKKKQICVPYNDILYFETGQHTVILHTTSDLVTFPGSLGQIAASFEQADNFLSVGRSFFINLDHVTGRMQNDLIMSDGSIVQVPLRKQEEVLAIVENWQRTTH